MARESKRMEAPGQKAKPGRGTAIPVNTRPSTVAAPDRRQPEAEQTVWEIFEEIWGSVPDEEFANLPRDGAPQHDHYIYGTPKRP